MNINAVLMLLVRCNRLFVSSFSCPQCFLRGVFAASRAKDTGGSKKLETKSLCSNVPKSAHKDASSFSYWDVSQVS